jgi:AcrR family transcriptional regulator
MSAEGNKSPQGTRARRRSPKAHRAILDATVRLLERGGYRNLTIEGVAAEAGVGKQTIYRWWKSKAELVMEAYVAASDARTPEPDTGTLWGDLEAILLPVFRLNEAFDRGTALANKTLMAQAQLEPGFLPVYVELHAYWRGPLRNVLARAKERSELHPDADGEALIDVLLGAAWYRLLLEHAPLDERFARQLAELVVKGAAASSPEQRR